MIDALDETIKQLLARELDADAQGIEISFSQPSGQWAAQRIQPTLNVYLYDVRENPTLRRHQWQPEPDDRRARDGTVMFKRTPLMLDCFYMVSAWSGAGEAVRPLIEHDLLSRALLALVQYPVLNPPFEELERAEALAETRYKDEGARELVKLEKQRARGQKSNPADVQRRAWLGDVKLNPLAALAMEVRTRIAQHDVLTNPAEVWSALEAKIKPGFSYVVTLPLDPWAQYETLRVSERRLRVEPVARDPRTGALLPMPPGDTGLLFSVGGVIRDGAGVALPGLRLQLLHGAAHTNPAANAHAAGAAAADDAAQAQAPHRHITKTNAAGEYTFAGLPLGAYTLFIFHKPGEIIVREFALSPAGATGFDFTI